MAFTTVIATLALLVPQASQQPSGGFAFAGFNVPLRFPDADARQIPDGLLDWHGWSYKSGALSLPNAAFPTGGDWAALRAEADSAKDQKDAATWREKIVVFTRTVLIDHQPDGAVRQRRGFMQEAELQEALQGIARSTVVAAARSKGQLKLLPDVSVESEPMLSDAVDGKRPFGVDFAQHYLESRVNGGTFEAEDKVYRGPYNGIVLVVPQSVADTSPVDTVVHGMPVRVVALDAPVAVPGVLETALDDALWSQARVRAKQVGFRTDGRGDPIGLGALTSFAEPSAEDLIARSTGSAVRVSALDSDPAPLVATSWKGQNTEVSLIPDTDRGQVLHLSMKAVQRAGGMELPVPEGGFAATAQTLKFYVRSKSTDPVAIHAVGADGTSVWYSLGRELPAPSEAKLPEALATAFTPDGTWQQVSIGLKPITKLARITIEPSPRSRFEERRYAFPIEYDFDAFELTNDASATVESQPDPDAAQAQIAATAFQSGNATPELAPLLDSSSDYVLLNALRAYTKVKDPAAEAGLEKAARSLNSPTQMYALQALANQGTDLSTTALRKALVMGTTEFERGIAAGLLTDNPPPNLSADLGLLVPLETWQGRVRAVEALSKLKGNAPGITMMTFIFHSDPAVKLAVTKCVDPSNEFQIRRVEWSAVNEPWDSVRVWSDAKLVQSKVDAFRSEGYKGVRDDSVQVRLEFVQWMGENPADTHVPALKLALTDTSYRVRAAALRALARQPGALKAEDFAAIMTDKYPEVQLALVELAKAKSVKLPAEMVERMKSSPVKEVSEAAASLES